MTARALALIGGGGFAKEVAEVARQRGFEVRAVYSTAPHSEVAPHRGYLNELLSDRLEYDAVALAVGGVSRKLLNARSEIIGWLREHALACPPLISPSAIVSSDVALGEGVFVAHGVIVNVGATLGAFSTLNSAAIIGHDVTICENATVSPGAFVGGRGRIGSDSLIGPMAKIFQGLTVGDGSIVGMGCNVFTNVPGGATVWPERAKLSISSSENKG